MNYKEIEELVIDTIYKSDLSNIPAAYIVIAIFAVFIFAAVIIGIAISNVTKPITSQSPVIIPKNSSIPMPVNNIHSNSSSKSYVAISIFDIFSDAVSNFGSLFGIIFVVGFVIGIIGRIIKMTRNI